MFLYGILIILSLISNGLCSQTHETINRWKVNLLDGPRPAAFCMASVAQTSDDSAVFIAGAWADSWATNTFSDTLSKYNATTKSFDDYAVRLPQGRILPTVVTMGSKVYIIGGGVATDDGLIYVDDMYEFDAVDETLDEIVHEGPNAPIGMLYGSAAQIDDEQFVLFSGEGPIGEITSNSIWSFNVASKEWTERMQMPGTGMRSNAAATLYDYFGVGKHGVFLLGGSISDPYSFIKTYDNEAWVLNPETWDIQLLPTDGSSGELPAGEMHKITTEKIPGGTRVWAFGAELNHPCQFQRRWSKFAYLDIPDGTDGSGPAMYWQALPLENPSAVVGGSVAAYMINRRPGAASEHHVLGFCFEQNWPTFFDGIVYSTVRDDPGAVGSMSLLNEDKNIVEAGYYIDYLLTAYGADGEPLGYGHDTTTSLMTYVATRERLFTKVADFGDGRYYFGFFPTTAGLWKLDVSINGQAVTNRGYTGSEIYVTVLPTQPVAAFSKIIGNGVINPTAGTWSAFTVQIKDAYNNTVLKDQSELANVSVIVQPNFKLPDGSTPSPLNYTLNATDTGIEIMYRANVTGSYNISVFMGEEVVGSSSGVTVNVVRDAVFNVDPPAAMGYSADSPQAIGTILLLFLTGVGVTLCAGCMIGIIVYKNENIIKAIDVKASLLCLFGLILLFVSGVFWISGEPTNTTCGMWPFFLSTGLGVVFSTLSAKIWQVYKIFTSKIKRKGSKWNAIIVQGIIILIDIAICGAWIIIDPPVPMVKYPETYSSHHDCGSSSTMLQALFLALIISFNGLLVFGGLGVAYLTRNLPSRFNQAAHIAVSMESFLILATFGLPVLEFLDKDLVAKTVLRFLIIWVPAMTTTLLLFGSRVYVAARTRRTSKTKSLSVLTSEATDSNTHSFVKYISTTADKEVPGEGMMMNSFIVFWCQEHWLFPNIWLKSRMFVVPSIGLLAFTDHEYGDAHMIIDSRSALLERIPANTDFQYMFRLRTQFGSPYLIGAFSSADYAKIDFVLTALIEKNVDPFQIPGRSRETNN